MCIQSGLRIVNGRVGNDYGIGKCTYIGSRGSSLIDYVLTMPDCMQMFNIFKVEDPNVLSDHCVIYFEYEYTLNTNSINSTTCNEGCTTIQYKFVWNKDHEIDFLDALRSEATQNNFLAILNALDNVHESKHALNTCVIDFVEIVEGVAVPYFKKQTRNKTNNNNNSNNNNNKWYDDNCRNKKLHFNYTLNKFRQCNSNQNRIELVKARSDMRKNIGKC